MQEYLYPNYADEAWLGYEDWRDYIEKILDAEPMQEETDYVPY